MATPKVKPPTRGSLLQRALGHLGVVVPAILGVGALLFSWVFAKQPVIPILVGMGSLFMSALYAAYRLIFKLPQIAKEEIERMNEEITRQERDRRYNLRRKLASDKFLKDEALFDELVELEQAFQGDEGWREDVDPDLVGQVLSRFQNGFESSLRLLERSHDLRNRGIKMSGEAKTTLVNAADDLVASVEAGIDELSKIYAGVQKLGIRRATTKDGGEADLRTSVADLKSILSDAQHTEDVRQGLLEGRGPNYQDFLEAGRTK